MSKLQKAMQSHNLCASCALSHKQPPYIEVLPEYTCSYCDKNQSQILYLGQPSCLKCQNKMSIAVSMKSIRQSVQHGCESSAIGSSNVAVINRKITKSGSQHKVMKRVHDILNNFNFTKSSVSKLKNLQFYWSRENNKDFSWPDFIQNVEKKSPIIFVMQVKTQIIGVFMSEHIEKKKGSTEDKYCGCFEINPSGIQFSQLQRNKFVVRHQKHIICYGSPGSVHIIFDTMEVEAEYFKDTLSHAIDQFAVIKL